MADRPIAPHVIVAAARALTHREWSEMSISSRAGMRDRAEAAIRAADEARGLREERMDRVHYSELIREVRLVSDWEEVKDG